jgi:hypothetical protein
MREITSQGRDRFVINLDRVNEPGFFLVPVAEFD